MAPQGYEEHLLCRWFPSAEIASHNREPFTENDIREISDILERSQNTPWSRIPRIYIVLRLIGKLDTIDSFIEQDISDTWFPFTQHTLPGVLCDHSTRSEFLGIQKLICNTRALNLERPGMGHGHFPDPSEIPLRKIGDLGKGGSGLVERVISTVSHQEYALKLIRRGTTFRKDKQVLFDYEKELSNLKRLSQSHRHIIELIGSYTDPKYVGLLFPVADCNLAELLQNPIFTNRRGSLRPYFGCLISALAYLHDNKIRHKDIKPQNILIKNGDPYFTDFGMSVDWSELSRDTTTGPTAMTPRYGAPEVAACEPRNSSSDIWSLGCVYLEIWNVLKDGSRNLLTTQFTKGGKVLPYCSQVVNMGECLQSVKRIPGPKSDNAPVIWIQHMLKRGRKDRWSAHLVMNSIRELSMDHSYEYLYIGRCCLDDDDSAESVISHSEIADSRGVPHGTLASGPRLFHGNSRPSVEVYDSEDGGNNGASPSHGSPRKTNSEADVSTMHFKDLNLTSSQGDETFLEDYIVPYGSKVKSSEYPKGVRPTDYLGMRAVSFDRELLHPYGILRAGYQYQNTGSEWFIRGQLSPDEARQLIESCRQENLLSNYSGGNQQQPGLQQPDRTPASTAGANLNAAQPRNEENPYGLLFEDATPRRARRYSTIRPFVEQSQQRKPPSSANSSYIDPLSQPTGNYSPRASTNSSGGSPDSPYAGASNYEPYESPSDVLAAYAKKYSLPSQVNQPTWQTSPHATNTAPNLDALSFLQARANYFQAHDPFRKSGQ